VAGGFSASLNLRLDEGRIIAQADHLIPHEPVQAVLSQGPLRTPRPWEPAISIRADATIVVQFLLGGSRGGPLQCVATLLA